MEHKSQNICKLKKLKKYERLSTQQILNQAQNSQLQRQYSPKLINSPNKSQLKLDKISAKIFWNKNSKVESSIQKIKQKNKKRNLNEPSTNFDLFNKQRKQYASIHEMKQRVNEMCLPIVKKYSPYKQKITDKASIHASISTRAFTLHNHNYKKQITKGDAKISNISTLIKKYKQRCKKEVEQFAFLFIKNEPIQERQPTKNISAANQSNGSNDESVPYKLLKSINVKKQLR